jgi:SEC-C motif
MAIGAETHIAAVRSYHPAISRQRMVLDERLGMAICGMTVDELRRLQEALHTLIREGNASEAQITKTVESQSKDMVTWLRFRRTGDDAATVVLLLGALAVAIAWLTYRAKPAPAPSIQHAIDSIDEGHTYLLPIPRCDPCFCGSGTKFKNCHGRPPSAAPTRCGTQRGSNSEPTGSGLTASSQETRLTCN